VTGIFRQIRMNMAAESFPLAAVKG